MARGTDILTVVSLLRDQGTVGADAVWNDAICHPLVSNPHELAPGIIATETDARFVNNIFSLPSNYLPA